MKPRVSEGFGLMLASVEQGFEGVEYPDERIRQGQNWGLWVGKSDGGFAHLSVRHTSRNICMRSGKTLNPQTLTLPATPSPGFRRRSFPAPNCSL